MHFGILFCCFSMCQSWKFYSWAFCCILVIVVGQAYSVHTRVCIDVSKYDSAQSQIATCQVHTETHTHTNTVSGGFSRIVHFMWKLKTTNLHLTEHLCHTFRCLFSLIFQYLCGSSYQHSPHRKCLGILLSFGVELYM